MTAGAAIESFWEYSDPAGSEARFREAIGAAHGDERLELLTQVARTYSLRKCFDDAHAVLDEVEPQLAGAGARPRIRYLLERGRTYNSAGDKTRARALFEEAWTRARDAREEGLAVDAAHMVAITHAGTEEALAWNRKGLDLARASSDSKARSLIPAVLNNAAWDLDAMGRNAEALTLFEEALVEWTKTGKTRQVQVARWSLAQCLRKLGRIGDAQAIEAALAAEGFTAP